MDNATLKVAVTYDTGPGQPMTVAQPIEISIPADRESVGVVDIPDGTAADTELTVGLGIGANMLLIVNRTGQSIKVKINGAAAPSHDIASGGVTLVAMNQLPPSRRITQVSVTTTVLQATAQQVLFFAVGTRATVGTGAPAAPVLTAPVDDAPIGLGAGITLTATTTDNDLDRIDFVLDPSGSATVIATDSAAPYTQLWTVVGALGAHTIVARAVRGAQHTDSAPIDVVIWSPLSLSANLYAWYRGDIETTNPVATWGNGNAGAGVRDLTQATGGAQPALVATDSRFNNKSGVDFDGTADNVKGSTASDWRLLHNGTGFTLAAEFHVTSGTTGNCTLVDTLNGTGANVGFEVIVDATNQRISVLMSNSSAFMINFQSANSSCLNGTKHHLLITYKEGRATNEYEIWLDGVQLTAGNVTPTPASGDPFGSLTVGKLTTAGSAFFKGGIAEIAIWDRDFTAGEIASWNAYAARYS